MKRTSALLFAIAAAMSMSGCAARVAEEKVVQVHYTGKVAADGSIFDSTEGRPPLELMIGEGFWIPALEQAMKGMKAGEKKQVKVPAAEAFGEYNAAATEIVPKEKFSDDIRFRIGMQVQTITAEGPTLATLIEIGPGTVTVDYNHPLAGKDLVFDLEILKIRNATKQELEKSKAAKAGAGAQNYFKFNENGSTTLTK